MAITFLEQRKRQKYLLPVLVLVFLITALVVWWGFFREEKIDFGFEEVLPDVSRKIEIKEINFNFLKSLESEKFQSFEQIPLFEEEAGRENPFIPFNLESE